MRATMVVMTVLMALPAAQAQQASAAPAKQPVGVVSPSRPRVGYAGTPTPPDTARRVRPTVAYTQGSYITTGAPYVVLSDGSVAVNFGNGYERVLRSCAASGASATTESSGRDVFGRIQDPPGIAALRPGARGQVAGTMPGRNVTACFTTDGQGRPEIVTQ